MIKGTLQANTKGYWTVYYSIKDETGKTFRSTKTTNIKIKKGNKRQAEIKMAEILKELETEQNRHLKGGDTLLVTYMQDWLNRRKAMLQETTFYNYEKLFERHIKPYFAAKNLAIDKVKAIDLETYATTKINEGLKANTVNKHLARIQAALNDAVRNDFIQKNPASCMQKPQNIEPEHQWYTTEQMRELWKKVQGTPIEAPVFFALFFGLRRSEALGVKWSAIDFEKKTLKICAKVARGNDNGVLRGVESNVLKTKASKRAYPLYQEQINTLLKIKEQQELIEQKTGIKSKYVCATAINAPPYPDTVTKSFKRFLEVNKMPHIRFHDLRHSAVSYFAGNPNFTMVQTQKFAGHANYNLTANTYSHVGEEITAKQVEALYKEIML